MGSQQRIAYVLLFISAIFATILGGASIVFWAIAILFNDSPYGPRGFWEAVAYHFFHLVLPMLIAGPGLYGLSWLFYRRKYFKVSIPISLFWPVLLLVAIFVKGYTGVGLLPFIQSYLHR